jgi:putative ABC transport system permease protein
VSWLGPVLGLTLHRDRAEQQLDAELRFDYDARVAENIRRGMSEVEARRVVRLEFGGLEQVKEECRDARGLQFLHSLLRDVRYALRNMRRSPGFTIVAVMTLALGIGMNATVFTLANSVLFKGFPLVDNSRIVYMLSGEPWYGVSWPDFEDWRAQAKSVDGLAAVRDLGIGLSDKNGLPERYEATLLTANAFKLIGQSPILGRDFTPADETPGAPPVTILSYAFWERRYRKDPKIVGQSVRINGAATTVIGIMARDFFFPLNHQDLWVPLVPTPDLMKREARTLPFVFGRLAKGVTIQDARAEMETIGKRLARTWPATDQSLPVVQNFRERYLGPGWTMIYESMWGAGGLVLLIACANLANLMLTRAIGRSREISVRLALGAGRWQVVRQLLTESVMLSGLGGVFGWWIARWGVPLLAGAPFYRPAYSDFEMDYRVLGYLMVISIGTGLLFGLSPALRLSRLDISARLKDGGRGATGGGRGKHLSTLLVVGEMALAVVLLAGAGVMIRSSLNIYAANAGVRTANVLTMYLHLPDAPYSGATAQTSFYNRLRTQLKAIPGVESVATADRFPTWPVKKIPYELAGVAPAGGITSEPRRPTVSALTVSPAYFRTLGADVVSGREFNEEDGISGVPVVIVNQRFAAGFWPGENPVGKRLRLFDGKTPEAWLTVVGVAPNIVQNDATRQKIDPLVYLPYLQKPAGFIVVFAHTHVPPGNLGMAFRRSVQAIDSDLAVLNLQSLERFLDLNYRDNGMIGLLFLLFASIALLLASIGLYVVIAHSVSQRTQEIGIRMAIGAKAHHILKLVFRQGMFPVGIGLLIGLAASFAVNRLLETDLVRVSPADPVTFAVTAAGLILAATLGCLIPARRAMRTDPADAIRHE